MANLRVSHFVTGGSYYYRLVRILDGFIWNNVLQVWAATVSWADSMVPVTEAAAGGDYPQVVPSGMNSGGRCTLILYTNTGAASTDVPAEKNEINIGSINGF